MNKIKYIAIIIACVAASKIWAQSNFIIEPLPLNNNNTNEKFAIPFQGGIIFSSDRRTHSMVSRIDTADNPLFHFFFLPNEGNPRSLSNNLPINAHHGTITISADGREIFFAANDPTGQRIYSARRSGNDWASIQSFAHNRTNFVVTHPSLSRDGTRLYFASNMPGGFGGFDIYVSERVAPGRAWGPPRNLGPGINTSEDELFPFIQENGELFFSSTAHGSMGGLDIFVAREINGEWGFVQRLEEPINSTADDISYIAANADGTSGYFASNRYGNFNIFSFQSLFPVFTGCREQEENDYTYIIEDPRLVITYPATFIYEWELGDGTVKQGDIIEHTFPSTGEFEIFLNVTDVLTGEFLRHVQQYLLIVEDIEQPYITISGDLKAGTPLIFDASNTFLPDIDIDEYYWIFGDGVRRRGMRVEHVYAAPGVYRVQLGVIGRPKYATDGEPEKFCVWIEIDVE